MATTAKIRCPECQSAHSLYGRADARWSDKLQEWVLGDLEDGVDCTSCDWTGSIEDLLGRC